jgi:hypothetical protein
LFLIERHRRLSFSGFRAKRMRRAVVAPVRGGPERPARRARMRTRPHEAPDAFDAA